MALRCPQMQLSRPGLQRPRHTRSVVVSAEKGAKPVREYQEETGEITAADGADNNPAKKVPLYADSVTMAKKQDNMSREMKQRLRQEYYGLGGAENKAMNSNYFLVIIVVISVLAVLSKLTGAI